MKPDNIFESLNLPKKNGIIYFHVAYNNVKDLFTLPELFDGLEKYFDPSTTICMPSFPFTGRDYFQYMMLNKNFDVTSTPATVNMVCEIFRRKKEVNRSLHPCFPVAAMGPRAEEIVGSHHLDTKTFGPKSPYQIISNLGGVVVGIGLDCNTNSFAHLLDDRLRSQIRFPIYEEGLFQRTCIDVHKNKILVTTDLLERNLAGRIKPRLLKPELEKKTYYQSMKISDRDFYALKIAEFVDEMARFSFEQTSITGVPPYYVTS